MKSASCSAVLALDLENFGHVESFLQKVDERVALQFRAADPMALKRLAAHAEAGECACSGGI